MAMTDNSSREKTLDKIKADFLATSLREAIENVSSYALNNTREKPMGSSKRKQV
ncbi:hypothetical protein QCM80_41550 [Bradyrhizobium sp. SSUT112]|uniref:hypothetical protein n=1 Tax=Bradyrhizobium sp. SSUT112 TaxID=3040604 RepID=UPI002448E9BF|nr:hypothetical protein [Bradyrhizobium sp. SSUT112]MDH2357032.1 hypothetical protein [Bradyrhizobium sp. SSUT112]